MFTMVVWPIALDWNVPNEGYTPTGLPWREGGLANSTTVTIMSKSMPFNGRFPPFDGLLIDAVLNVTFRCRYSISVGICPVDFLCPEVCKIRSADSLVALKLSTQSLPVQLIFSRGDDGSYQIKPNATVRVKFDDFEFGRCGANLIKVSYGPLRDYFNITGEKLLPQKLNEKFDRVLNNSITIKGGEYRPTSDLVVGYRISNLTFDPNWVRADFSMNVSAVLNGSRVYYEFSPNHTVTGPSTEFQALSKLIQSPTGSIATLNALRVSLDIATAVMGAAAMVYTTFSNITRISDAEIEYSVTIAGPELSVPEGTSNVIQALLPLGKIIATCNSEPNRGEPLVSINFNDVAGSMSIEYTVGNASSGLLPGLVLQYRDLNVSGARIRLTAPPFPIAGDVLQNAVEQSMRARQIYINDQLRARPLQLPASLVPFFPSPRVTVTPVARGSGFFELATRCKCGGVFEDFDALRNSCKVRSCTDCVSAALQCSWCGDLCFDGASCPGGTSLPLNDSTLCPPISGGFENYCRFECSKIATRRRRGVEDAVDVEPVQSSRLLEAAANVEADAARRRVAAVRQRHAALVSEFDAIDEVPRLARRATGQSYVVQTYETGNCSLAVPGTWYGSLSLMETDGVCVENEGVYYLSYESRGPFYSIRRNPDGTYRLKLMCSAIDCLQCAVVQRAAALNTCYPTQVSQSVSFTMQAQDGNECIGGHKDDGEQFVVLYSFDNTSTCNTAVQSAAVADVVSFGTPQSIAALAQCTDLDPTDEYRSSYSRVVFESSPAPRISSLEFLCLGGCVNCTIRPDKPIAVGDSGCFAGQTTVRDMSNAASTYTWAVQAKMFGGCAFLPPVPRMVEMNVTRTEAPDLLGDSDTVLYALGIVLAIVLAIVCLLCAVRLPVVAGLIDPNQGSRIAGIRHWLSRHSWSIGLPQRGVRWQFMFNLLAVVLGVVMVVVWSAAHAIRLIDANFLSENFSVDEKYDEYISSSALSDRFIVWEQSGTILMSIEVAIMALLLIDTLVARHHLHDMPDKKKKHNLVGIRVRKSLWFLVLAGHVSMLLVLPLQTAFGVRDDVKFDASSVESLSAAKTTIDTALGYAASLFMFNVVLTFFTNLLQLIPAGILLGTALYVGDVGERSQVARGVVVGRGVWVTAALVTIAAHIIVPVALSPAVLIYLHRRGMASSFWVGLVWLVQWVGSLLLVALVFFRRVGPAPDKRGHVLVFSHIFFCAYFAIMGVTTVVEISYTITGGSQLSYHMFMLLYRLTSFLIATCFTRVWLQAYRPQYSRAALKARREKEHVEAAKAEVDAAAAAAAAGDDGQQEGESKFEKAVSPFTAMLGRVGGLVAKPIMVPLASVAYAIEVGRPTTDSLPYRRTWWFFGVIFLIVVLIDNFVVLINKTAKEEAIASFNQYSDQLYGLTWPPDDVGGAIFDPAFSLFNTLRWTKFIIVVLVGALIAGLLIDDFRCSRISQEATQRSVWRAQQAAYLVIIALFVAAVTPSVPDYPAVASLKQVLPKCGYNFNDFVQNMYGSIVGSVLTLFTLQVLLPVLTIIMPSLSRTCKMVIHGVLDAHHHDDDGGGHGHGHDDGHDDKSSCASRVLSFHPEDGPAPPAVIDHAHMLFQMSMIVSPLLVGLALIFFFVFFGNTFTLIMILLNFVGPIFVAQLLSPFAITTSYFAAVWFFYFPSLMAIFLEYAYRMGYLDPSKVAAYLSSWGFWITFIFVVAEVCLANVLVADIVYLLIWSLYPEYSVLGADIRAAVLSERSATMSNNTMMGGGGGGGGYNGGGTSMVYDNGFGGNGTYNGHGGAITVANPMFGAAPGHGGTMSAATAVMPDPNRASVAIRELDDEFGGQRYGNAPPPDAPFLSARNDMMSARDMTLRDRGVTTFGMQDLPAPSFKSRAFTDFTSMQSLQSAPSMPGGFMSATPTQLNLMNTGTSSGGGTANTSGVVHSPRPYNPGGQFVCAVCGNTYPLQSDLDVHMTKRHPMVLDI
jgi:hypothetical protein